GGVDFEHRVDSRAHGQRVKRSGTLSEFLYFVRTPQRASSVMRHKKQMRVRFGHSDPARIVYYPRFFEWFHDIFESMFEDVFKIHYAAVLNERRVGFPAVQVACEFLKPATFGELVDIEVFLSRLSERSATFEYRVRRDGVLLVTASVKVA